MPFTKKELADLKEFDRIIEEEFKKSPLITIDEYLLDEKIDKFAIDQAKLHGYPMAVTSDEDKKIIDRAKRKAYQKKWNHEHLAESKERKRRLREENPEYRARENERRRLYQQKKRLEKQKRKEALQKKLKVPLVTGVWIDHEDECECSNCHKGWNKLDNCTEEFIYLSLIHI